MKKCIFCDKNYSKICYYCELRTCDLCCKNNSVDCKLCGNAVTFFVCIKCNDNNSEKWKEKTFVKKNL